MAYNIVSLKSNLGNFNYMDYYKDLNFSNALINAFQNVDSNYYKIGNVNLYGLELSITKGNFTLDKVFYTKPYPTANVYSVGYDYDFTFKINYKFNPYIYFHNGYIFNYTDLNDKTNYLINGFPLENGNTKLLVDGFNLKFYQNTDSTSDFFYINSSGGSFYTNPLLTNYGEVNYNISNYSNTYYSYSGLHNVDWSTYGANLTGSNLYLKELTTDTGNISNSLGAYFRDFNTTRTDVVVGYYNNPLGDWENSPSQAYWRINYEKIPNLYNFLGATDYNGFNSSLLTLTPSNELKLTNDFWHIQYTQNNDKNPSFWTKSLSADQLDNLVNTFGTFPSLMDLPDFKFIRSFRNTDNILNRDITANVQHVRSDYYGNSIRNTFLGNYSKYDMLPVDFNSSQVTFSNTFYTNTLTNFDLRCSGLDYDLLGLELSGQQLAFVSNAFNATMAISFAGMTIGGLATAIFLFRAIVSFIRSNK